MIENLCVRSHRSRYFGFRIYIEVSSTAPDYPNHNRSIVAMMVIATAMSVLSIAINQNGISCFFSINEVCKHTLIVVPPRLSHIYEILVYTYILKIQ